MIYLYNCRSPHSDSYLCPQAATVAGKPATLPMGAATSLINEVSDVGGESFPTWGAEHVHEIPRGRRG